MPFKHRQFIRRRSKKRYQAPKRNWSEYNKSMKQRGDIAIWLSPDVIDAWYINDRRYVGDGASRENYT